VRRGNDWIPPEQATALRTAAAREEAERQAAAREARVLRTMELLALGRLVEASEPPPRGLPVYPVVVIPGGGHGHHHGGGWADTPANRETLDDLVHRNPGSLLPVGRHRNTRNPGSLLPVERGRSNRGGFGGGETDSGRPDGR
jgi:hypothetical protein